MQDNILKKNSRITQYARLLDEQAKLKRFVPRNRSEETSKASRMRTLGLQIRRHKMGRATSTDASAKPEPPLEGGFTFYTYNL